MEIIDVDFLTKEEESRIVELASARSGFAHFANSSWVTYVIQELTSTGVLVKTIAKAMEPALIPGELKWAALPDPGNRLVVSKGVWVEPRGVLTYASGAAVAVSRGCKPQNSAFIGAMACLAAGYKLIKEDGSDCELAYSGDVFSWAVYNTQAARGVLDRQREARHAREAEEALQRAAKIAELVSRASVEFGQDTAKTLFHGGVLCETLLVPQYARALRSLIATGYPVSFCRKNFRTITGVWVQDGRGQAAKSAVLAAYEVLIH